MLLVTQPHPQSEIYTRISMRSVGRRTEAPCAMRQRNACRPRRATMTSGCSQRSRNRPMPASICANAATKAQRFGSMRVHRPRHAARDISAGRASGSQRAASAAWHDMATVLLTFRGMRTAGCARRSPSSSESCRTRRHTLLAPAARSCRSRRGIERAWWAGHPARRAAVHCCTRRARPSSRRRQEAPRREPDA